MRFFRCCLAALAVLAGGCETPTTPEAAGAQRPQFLLVSSAQVNQSAADAYRKVIAEARAKGTLDRDAAEVQRIKLIAGRLIGQTGAFRKDAPGWEWETHVLTSTEVNAWCMPGGKIAVYTALVERLKATDAELAAVIGHEIGHALREHGRERVSLALAQEVALNVITAVANVPQSARDLAPMVLDLTVNLPHSRGQETEADRVGIELAARAGYDPRAAVALWEKMEKMGGAQPPKFLSTHPSHEDRISDLREQAEKVLPLYQAATRGRAAPP